MGDLYELRPPPRPDSLICAGCGSGWFRLVRPGAGDAPGAVCMNANRVVTGYCGRAVCVDCGTFAP